MPGLPGSRPGMEIWKREKENGTANKNHAPENGAQLHAVHSMQLPISVLWRHR